GASGFVPSCWRLAPAFPPERDCKRQGSLPPLRARDVPRRLLHFPQQEAGVSRRCVGGHIGEFPATPPFSGWVETSVGKGHLGEYSCPPCCRIQAQRYGLRSSFVCDDPQAPSALPLRVESAGEPSWFLRPAAAICHAHPLQAIS